MGKNLFSGSLIDNRAFMKSPPPPPAQPAPPGLDAVDLSAIVGSWSTYHVGTTPPAALVLDTAGRNVVTMEVGPDSLWDTMQVQPANGPAMLLGPGQRYPVGQWKGPIQIRPNVGRPRFPILSTAAFGTWVVSSNALSPQIALGAPLFVPPLIELVAYPSRELADAMPLGVRRAPLAFQATVTGSDVPGSTFLAALVPTFGRTGGTRITLYNANVNDWTGVIWGYRGSAAVTIVWPILPATTFAVAGGETLTIEIDGAWDYLGVAGAWDAGAAQDLVINIDARDA